MVCELFMLPKLRLNFQGCNKNLQTGDAYTNVLFKCIILIPEIADPIAKGFYKIYSIFVFKCTF